MSEQSVHHSDGQSSAKQSAPKPSSTKKAIPFGLTLLKQWVSRTSA